MKVLHVTFSDNFGGANIAAFRLHEALQQKIDSKLVVYNKNKKSKKILKFNDSSLLGHQTKNYLSKILLFFFKKKNNNSLNIFNSNLLDIINKSNADIIHLHWINNEILSIKDISKIDKKIVWTTHDMWPFSGTEHYSDDKKYINGYKKIKTNYFTFDISLFIWKLKKKYYSNRINFIAPSLWIKKKIQKSYLCKNNSVYLIRNPIDMSIWKYRKYKKKNNKIILAVCAFDLFLDNRKGFTKMINDLNKIHYKQDIEIYAIGNKTNLEIKSNIKIKSFGYIKNEKKISKIFNKCDALLMPSEADNFPNVGVEALASGLPVISLKNNGINEIISNKINGLSINNFNKNNIKKMMNWLIKIKKENHNFKISNSMRRVINYESVSKKMINIYKKILDE